MLSPIRKTTCLAAALCLAQAGTAIASPAGSEYFPQGPKSSGKQSGSSGKHSSKPTSGGTGSSSAADTSTTSTATVSSPPSVETKQPAVPKNVHHAPKVHAVKIPKLPTDPSLAAIDTPVAQDGGGNGTLNAAFDPPVLAAIVLLAIALTALLLRRGGGRRTVGPEASPPTPADTQGKAG